MKKLKFLYTVLLSSLIILIGSKSLSYAETSVEQLIIINSAYNTLNFYENGSLVREFNCATGALYTQTPQGKTTVANKIKNRPYYKYGIPGGSPNNPLGKRWIGLFGGEVYAIHGTNAPSSIGSNASHGCVRMHNSDVEWLYDQISIGATVLIKNTYSSDDQIAEDNGILLGYKWTTKGKDKYFSKNNNEYATGWNIINGKKYYFNNKGVLQTGLQTIEGNVYYLGKDGAVQTGWKNINGNKYYFEVKGDKRGQAVIGQVKLDKKDYYFGKDGAMVTSKRVKVGDNYYYFGEDGVKVTSEKVKVGDNYYYFGEDGAMVTSKNISIGDDNYYFGEDGTMARFKMIKLGNKYCYFKSSGKMVKYLSLKISFLIVGLISTIVFIIAKRNKYSEQNKEDLATNI